MVLDPGTLTLYQHENNRDELIHAVRPFRQTVADLLYAQKVKKRFSQKHKGYTGKYGLENLQDMSTKVLSKTYGMRIKETHHSYDPQHLDPPGYGMKTVVEDLNAPLKITEENKHGKIGNTQTLKNE